MPHLVKWYQDLAPFGLKVIGAHSSGTGKNEILTKARALNMNFTVTLGGSVQNIEGRLGIPHVILFDHTGKCVFRGHPKEVERKLYAALAESMLEKVKLEKPANSVKQLMDALSKASPVYVLSKALPLQKAADPKLADDAKQLVKAMLSHVDEELKNAEELAKEDKLAAYDILLPYGNYFKGTTAATKAESVIAELKKDKQFTLELKARTALEPIRKAELQLSLEADKHNVSTYSEDFNKAYYPQLLQLKTSIQKLKKDFPETRALETALDVAEKFGLTIK